MAGVDPLALGTWGHLGASEEYFPLRLGTRGRLTGFLGENLLQLESDVSMFLRFAIDILQKASVNSDVSKIVRTESDIQ